jgi:hypothetical protein
MYTSETIGDAVRSHIRQKYKRQKVAAAKWGISGTMVSQVVTGHRKPSAVILADMGLFHRHLEVYEAQGANTAQPPLDERVETLERAVASLGARTIGLVRLG